MNRVVNTYVRALYLSAMEANLDSQVILDIGTNLTRVSDAVGSSKELRSVMKNPSIPTSDKLAILRKLVVENGSVKLLEQFFLVLSGKGRLELLSSLGEAFNEVRLESQGSVLGLAESAEALKDSDLQELSSSFEKKLGKKVFFKTKIDPQLLAGVKVTVNGVTYDGTVRAQLNQLRDEMSQSKT